MSNCTFWMTWRLLSDPVEVFEGFVLLAVVEEVLGVGGAEDDVAFGGGGVVVEDGGGEGGGFGVAVGFGEGEEDEAEVFIPGGAAGGVVVRFLFFGEFFPALDELAGAAEIPVEFAGEVFEVGELFLRGGGGGDGLVGEVGAAIGGFVFEVGEGGAGKGELAGCIEQDAEFVGAVEDGADVLGELADVGAVVA